MAQNMSPLASHGTATLCAGDATRVAALPLHRSPSHLRTARARTATASWNPASMSAKKRPATERLEKGQKLTTSTSEMSAHAAGLGFALHHALPTEERAAAIEERCNQAQLAYRPIKTPRVMADRRGCACAVAFTGRPTDELSARRCALAKPPSDLATDREAALEWLHSNHTDTHDGDKQRALKTPAELLLPNCLTGPKKGRGSVGRRIHAGTMLLDWVQALASAQIEVRRTPGRGLGLFSSSDIEKGVWLEAVGMATNWLAGGLDEALGSKIRVPRSAAQRAMAAEDGCSADYEANGGDCTLLGPLALVNAACAAHANVAAFVTSPLNWAQALAEGMDETSLKLACRVRVRTSRRVLAGEELLANYAQGASGSLVCAAAGAGGGVCGRKIRGHA